MASRLLFLVLLAVFLVWSASQAVPDDVIVLEIDKLKKASRNPDPDAYTQAKYFTYNPETDASAIAELQRLRQSGAELPKGVKYVSAIKETDEAARLAAIQKQLSGLFPKLDAMLPHVNGRRALARQLLKVDEDRPVAELLDLIIKQHRLEFGEGYFVTNANLVEKETVKFLPNQARDRVIKSIETTHGKPIDKIFPAKPVDPVVVKPSTTSLNSNGAKPTLGTSSTNPQKPSFGSSSTNPQRPSLSTSSSTNAAKKVDDVAKAADNAGSTVRKGASAQEWVEAQAHIDFEHEMLRKPNNNAELANWLDNKMTNQDYLASRLSEFHDAHLMANKKLAGTALDKPFKELTKGTASESVSKPFLDGAKSFIKANKERPDVGWMDSDDVLDRARFFESQQKTGSRISKLSQTVDAAPCEGGLCFQARTTNGLKKPPKGAIANPKGKPLLVTEAKFGKIQVHLDPLTRKPLLPIDKTGKPLPLKDPFGKPYKLVDEFGREVKMFKEVKKFGNKVEHVPIDFIDQKTGFAPFKKPQLPPPPTAPPAFGRPGQVCRFGKKRSGPVCYFPSEEAEKLAVEAKKTADAATRKAMKSTTELAELSKVKPADLKKMTAIKKQITAAQKSGTKGAARVKSLMGQLNKIVKASGVALTKDPVKLASVAGKDLQRATTAHAIATVQQKTATHLAELEKLQKGLASAKQLGKAAEVSKITKQIEGMATMGKELGRQAVELSTTGAKIGLGKAALMGAGKVVGVLTAAHTIVETAKESAELSDRMRTGKWDARTARLYENQWLAIPDLVAGKDGTRMLGDLVDMASQGSQKLWKACVSDKTLAGSADKMGNCAKSAIASTSKFVGTGIENIRKAKNACMKKGGGGVSGAKECTAAMGAAVGDAGKATWDWTAKTAPKAVKAVGGWFSTTGEFFVNRTKKADKEMDECKKMGPAKCAKWIDEMKKKKLQTLATGKAEYCKKGNNIVVRCGLIAVDYYSSKLLPSSDNVHLKVQVAKDLAVKGIKDTSKYIKESTVGKAASSAYDYTAKAASDASDALKSSWVGKAFTKSTKTASDLWSKTFGSPAIVKKEPPKQIFKVDSTKVTTSSTKVVSKPTGKVATNAKAKAKSTSTVKATPNSNGSKKATAKPEKATAKPAAKKAAAKPMTQKSTKKLAAKSTTKPTTKKTTTTTTKQTTTKKTTTAKTTKTTKKATTKTTTKKPIKG